MSPEFSKFSLKVGIGTALSMVALAGVAEQSTSSDFSQKAYEQTNHFETAQLNSTTLELGILAMAQPKIMPIPINTNHTIEAHVQLIASKKPHPKPKPQPKLPLTLRRIGGCESAGSPTAKINYKAQNPISTASGGFQFLDTTWNDYRGYKRAKDAPPSTQKRRAIIEYKRNGTNPWVSSKACWD